MKELKFFPRFKDTDALGHINNASFSTWFEEGRRPIFQLFIPDLNPVKWNLIIARIEVDFVAEGFYQKETTIKTWVEKIGNSSFVLYQEALQEEKIIGKARAYLVHYDYGQKKSVPIPEPIRKKLADDALKENH